LSASLADPLDYSQLIKKPDANHGNPDDAHFMSGHQVDPIKEVFGVQTKEEMEAKYGISWLGSTNSGYKTYKLVAGDASFLEQCRKFSVNIYKDAWGG
jgi:hypothetical protein